MIKLGDRVAAQPDFKIESLVGETYYITFANGLKWQIPVYLSALGIFTPPADFCYPGSHWPRNHPDYLRRESLSTSGAWYNYKGTSVRIEIGSDFHTTGKYLLQGVRSSKTIVKYASLRSESDRNDVITAYIGQSIQGEALIGYVIAIFCRWEVRGNGTKDIDIEFFDNTQEALEVINEPKDVMILIHDPVSYIEYELPLILIRKL